MASELALDWSGSSRDIHLARELWPLGEASIIDLGVLAARATTGHLFCLHDETEIQRPLHVTPSSHPVHAVQLYDSMLAGNSSHMRSSL